jgi:uncharacterized protein YpmB
MNTLIVACIISAIYVVVNMAFHYKESPTPNIKEGSVVLLSSMVGLHLSSQVNLQPKVTEVFTESPSF